MKRTYEALSELTIQVKEEIEHLVDQANDAIKNIKYTLKDEFIMAFETACVISISLLRFSNTGLYRLQTLL